MKRRLNGFGNLVLLVALLVSITACGGESSNSFAKIGSGLSGGGSTGETAPVHTEPGTIAGKESRAPESAPGLDYPRVGGSGSAEMSATSTTGADGIEGSHAPGVAGTTDGYGSAPPAGGESGLLNTGKGNQQPQYQAPPLTAGQVDDNAKFTEYLDYLRNYTMGRIMPVDVSQRLFVRVVDGSQQPVAGADVQIFAGDRQLFEGRTVSDGRVLFFPSAVDTAQATEFRAVVSRRQSKAASATVRAGSTEQVVTLGDVKDNSGPVGIDLVFLLDATGSMGDEIEKIKATVSSIASRIEQLPGSSAPRFGLVAFRDRGDDYVTRSWNFTSNIEEFAGNLNNVSAGGGGDTPESVNAGLNDAIHLPGWADASSGRHLRMIVLVGDAPPHLDYQDDYSYPTLLQEAVASGIKIFPVGASNLESDGEYIFRQFAEMTQGQFVFLTYANGVSGAPGLSTDKHVTDFSVQNLDTLIVNLVAGEIANQTGQQTGVAKPVPALALVEPPAGVVPAAQVATGLAAMLDDFVGGRGGVFWAALLLLVGAVVLSTRSQIRARVAQPQSPEIYVAEGNIAEEEMSQPVATTHDRRANARVLAAHLQPTTNEVELYIDVEEGSQPTMPLR